MLSNISNATTFQGNQYRLRYIHNHILLRLKNHKQIKKITQKDLVA